MSNAMNRKVKKPNPGSWKKGESGNPNGSRKPTGRSLVRKLASVATHTMRLEGEQIEFKEVLALMLWEAAITGKVTLHDRSPVKEEERRSLELDPKQWFEVAKSLITYIDGPPRQLEPDINGMTESGGNVINAEVFNDAASTAKANLAEWREQRRLTPGSGSEQQEEEA